MESMSILGKIVFGPNLAPDLRSASGYRVQDLSMNIKQTDYRACNCIGPQPGQTKCPCALQGEAEVGRKMVEDGVTINGKRYRLVPE
jgi:hypothetical protein